MRGDDPRFRFHPAHPLPTAYVPAPMEPTKKPIGRLDRYASAMADHTVPSAITTDRPIAVNGLSVNDRAAAAGLMHVKWEGLTVVVGKTLPLVRRYSG